VGIWKTKIHIYLHLKAILTIDKYHELYYNIDMKTMKEVRGMRDKVFKFKANGEEFKFTLSKSNSIRKLSNKEMRDTAYRVFKSDMEDILQWNEDSFLSVEAKAEDCYRIVFATGGYHSEINVFDGMIVYYWVWGSDRMIVHLEGYYIGQLIEKKIEKNLSYLVEV